MSEKTRRILLGAAVFLAVVAAGILISWCLK